MLKDIAETFLRSHNIVWIGVDGGKFGLAMKTANGPELIRGIASIEGGVKSGKETPLTCWLRFSTPCYVTAARELLFGSMAFVTVEGKPLILDHDPDLVRLLQPAADAETTKIVEFVTYLARP